MKFKPSQGNTEMSTVENRLAMHQAGLDEFLAKHRAGLEDMVARSRARFDEIVAMSAAEAARTKARLAKPAVHMGNTPQLKTKPEPVSMELLQAVSSLAAEKAELLLVRQTMTGDEVKEVLAAENLAA
jgi:hypothetical protein